MLEVVVWVEEASGGWSAKVRVVEGRGESSHEITMDRETYKQLAKGLIPPEECFRRAFEFLLARESKESILGKFDITEISRYFPEFEEEFHRGLSK